jgi:uncharacterized protein YktB (UPF0637 family)
LSSFRLTEQDFRDCRPRRPDSEALQRLRNRLKELANILEKKLPPSFKPFKKSIYVSRIRVRGGDLRKEMWIGMANSNLYQNPRDGIQFQFGIDNENIWCMGIFIDRYASKARLAAKIRISAKRTEFLKKLKKMGKDFYICCGNLDKCVTVLVDEDVTEIIENLSRPHTLFIDKGNIPKSTAINYKDKIVDEIIATYKKLLPLYRFLSEGKVEIHPERSRSVIPSSDAIYASDRRGMTIAKRFERTQNRKPKDVSSYNLGYDIKSKDKNGRTRYIEVKSRSSGYRVVLTSNELEAAKKLKKNYYLYIVLEDGIRIIQNPIEVCEMKKVQVIQYEVSGWRKEGKFVRLPWMK